MAKLNFIGKLIKFKFETRQVAKENVFLNAAEKITNSMEIEICFLLEQF